MTKNKTYWSGLEELDRTPEFERMEAQEFPDDRPVDQFLSDDRLQRANTGRRDFLKFMGFSLTAATLAACETPVVKSIPYTNKPEEITPGVANYYASTFYDGHDFVNVMVKTREGRPIFIKSNGETGIGVVNSRVNSSMMGLYDSARLTKPRVNGKEADWDAVDDAVAQGMASAGRKVLLTNTVLSPSLRRSIALAKDAGLEHIQLDSVSYGAITEAVEADYGVRAFPEYEFADAECVVSVGADFLGTWGDSVRYSCGWTSGRAPEKGAMSRLYAFESNMSLTGSNADVRVRVKPSDAGRVLAALYRELTGVGKAVALDDATMADVKRASADLKKAGSAALVIAGDNNVGHQRIALAINRFLGSVGQTLLIPSEPGLFQGDDRAYLDLVKSMKAGEVSTLVVYGVNPAYHGPDAQGFREGLNQVKTSVSTALFADETGSLCTVLAPRHHWLESWDDLMLRPGRMDIAQPTIQPLYDTRHAGESLLTWIGQPMDWYSFMRATQNPSYVEDDMYRDVTWNEAVHNGVLMTGSTERQVPVFLGGDLSAMLRDVNAR